MSDNMQTWSNIHVSDNIQTWSQIHVSDYVVSTWRHADTPCPYPHGNMETLHVYIHMETCRHSMSIST